MKVFRYGLDLLMMLATVAALIYLGVRGGYHLITAFRTLSL